MGNGSGKGRVEEPTNRALYTLNKEKSVYTNDLNDYDPTQGP